MCSFERIGLHFKAISRRLSGLIQGKSTLKCSSGRRKCISPNLETDSKAFPLEEGGFWRNCLQFCRKTDEVGCCTSVLLHTHRQFYSLPSMSRRDFLRRIPGTRNFGARPHRVRAPKFLFGKHAAKKSRPPGLFHISCRNSTSSVSPTGCHHSMSLLARPH